MIRFKVEMDDLIAFNQHSIATSPQHQANRKRSIVVIASVFMLLGGLQSFLHKSFAPLAVWAIVTALYCPWLYKKSGKVSAKKIQQLYSEGKDRLVLCEHEMEHLQDGFIDKTPLGEAQIKFPAIVRIDDTPSHYFIFTGSMQAHIIPKGKVCEGDLVAFVARLLEGRIPTVPSTTISCPNGTRRMRADVGAMK